MKKLVCLLLCWLSCAASVALASGADMRLAPAPVNRLDEESLQRGARNFVNYCLTCHTARYMRYNRLTDLGLSPAQIEGIENNLATESGRPCPLLGCRKEQAQLLFGMRPH